MAVRLQRRSVQGRHSQPAAEHPQRLTVNTDRKASAFGQLNADGRAREPGAQINAAPVAVVHSGVRAIPATDIANIGVCERAVMLRGNSGTGWRRHAGTGQNQQDNKKKK